MSQDYYSTWRSCVDSALKKADLPVLRSLIQGAPESIFDQNENSLGGLSIFLSKPFIESVCEWSINGSKLINGTLSKGDVIIHCFRELITKCFNPMSLKSWLLKEDYEYCGTEDFITYIRHNVNGDEYVAIQSYITIIVDELLRIVCHKQATDDRIQSLYKRCLYLTCAFGKRSSLRNLLYLSSLEKYRNGVIYPTSDVTQKALSYCKVFLKDTGDMDFFILTLQELVYYYISQFEDKNIMTSTFLDIFKFGIEHELQRPPQNAFYNWLTSKLENGIDFQLVSIYPKNYLHSLKSSSSYGTSRAKYLRRLCKLRKELRRIGIMSHNLAVSKAEFKRQQEEIAETKNKIFEAAKLI